MTSWAAGNRLVSLESSPDPARRAKTHDQARKYLLSGDVFVYKRSQHQYEAGRLAIVFTAVLVQQDMKSLRCMRLGPHLIFETWDMAVTATIASRITLEIAY